MTREELLARKKLIDSGLSASEAEKQYKIDTSPVPVESIPTQSTSEPVNNTPVFSTEKITDSYWRTAEQRQEQLRKLSELNWGWAKWELSTAGKYWAFKEWETKNALWSQYVTGSEWDNYNPWSIKTTTEDWVSYEWTITDAEKIQNETNQFNLDQSKREEEINRTDSNAIYSKLINWELIDKWVKDTTAYKQANERYTAFNKYNSMTASQMSNAINWWQLVPWTDVYNDLMKTDPSKVRAAENASVMSKMLSNDWEESNFQDIISQYILNNFIWDTDSLKNSISTNPEIIRLNSSATEKKAEIDELKDQIDNAEDDILKELEWTWATSSYKNALLSKRLKWLYRQYELKSSDYNTTIWQLQQTTDNIKYEYEQTEENQSKWLEALLALNELSQPWTSWEWAKLDDNTLYNKATWEYKSVWNGWSDMWNNNFNKSGFNKSMLPQYVDYIETWKIPTWLQFWTSEYNNFINEANKWYIEAKNKEFSSKWFTIENQDAFINTTAKQKEEISSAVNNVLPFIQSMDKVIALTKKYWNESTLSEWWAKINQEIRNAQLLAKEIYNLWVLNWPDLALMEDIITNPTNLLWIGLIWRDYEELVKNWKKTILDNAVSRANSIWLSFDWNEFEQSTWEWINNLDDTFESLYEQIEW